MKNKIVSLRATRRRLNKLLKDIQANNKAFKRAALERQRVMIARDVRELLTTGFLSTRKVTYCTMRLPVFHDDDQLRDLMLKAPSCTVCGIGGTFVALLLRNDNLSACEADVYSSPTHGGNVDVSDGTMRTYLGRYFSSKQIRLIEAVFENFTGSCGYLEDVPRSQRLDLIMQNIIMNKGTLMTNIPPVKVGRRWMLEGFTD